MAVDAAMRKLKVPPKFVPYLEKHRIYELFHELGNELALDQPDDPLLFLKHCLEKLDRGRDKHLILLLAPPPVDRIKLAHLLSVKTGCSILSRYLVCSNHYDSDSLAANTSNIIRSSDKQGWILADFPDTLEEAKRLIFYGVIPSHSFLILPSEVEIQHDKDETGHIVKTTPSLLFEYNMILKMKELFKSSIKRVQTNNRSLDDVANACARLTMKMPRRHAPKLFRVALVGPRGSRRRTLAKLLHKKFHLVHIDMELLINAARNSETDLGDKIRYLDDNDFPYTIKIVFDLLKNKMYQKDCLERGYILTNFPTSLEDFVLLDSTDTPPNRVIFLDIAGSECQERLDDRVVNMYTGSLHSVRAMKKNHLLKSQTLTHPNDESCKVAEEIKFYNDRVQPMLDYCGKTCSVIDARGPITTLLERVEAVLMGPSPAAAPRSGKLPPRYSVEKQTLDSGHKRLPYPLSRTEVVPLIDSADLIDRFKQLKKGSRDHHRVMVVDPESSTNIIFEKDNGEESEGESSSEGSGSLAIKDKTEHTSSHSDLAEDANSLQSYIID